MVVFQDLTSVFFVAGRPRKRLKDDPAFEFASCNKNRNQLRCRFCFLFPDIVRRSPKVYHNRLPGLCTADGAIPREDDLRVHLSADYHAECIKAHELRSLKPVDRLKSSRIRLQISEGNRQLARIAGKNMIHVYWLKNLLVEFSVIGLICLHSRLLRRHQKGLLVAETLVRDFRTVYFNLYWWRKSEHGGKKWALDAHGRRK